MLDFFVESALLAGRFWVGTMTILALTTFIVIVLAIVGGTIRVIRNKED